MYLYIPEMLIFIDETGSDHRDCLSTVEPASQTLLNESINHIHEIHSQLVIFMTIKPQRSAMTPAKARKKAVLGYSLIIHEH